MNLSRARLCLDCETLHEDRVCPLCASGQWSLIVKWLSRTAPPKHAQVTVPRSDVSRILDTFAF